MSPLSPDGPAGPFKLYKIMQLILQNIKKQNIRNQYKQS